MTVEVLDSKHWPTVGTPVLFFFLLLLLLKLSQMIWISEKRTEFPPLRERDWKEGEEMRKKEPKTDQWENALLALQASRHAVWLSATSAVRQKHGGVQRSSVHVKFSRSVSISPQSHRRCCRRFDSGGASSPPLWVQVQLQRTAPVSVRRRYPVLDSRWK